jgi:very-short-patch-repair endonuclease
MAEKRDTPDGRAGLRAAGQHGVVTIAQLREAGLSDDAVLDPVRAGRLIRLHRGVFAVGHQPATFESRCLAAVLACGAGALVSRRSAAALWRLLDPDSGPIHVSVPGRAGRRQHQGVVVHRCPSLTPEQASRSRRIPVTSPARTISDLRRGEATSAELRRAIRQAEVRGLRTGLPKRAAATRSELEDLFLALCRRHGLPKPEVNVRIGALTVDFFWPQQRLVVETDGYRFHRGSSAFEIDHDRDLRLRTAGFDVLRLTYHHVTTEPTRVATLVRRELTESKGSLRPNHLTRKLAQP